WHFLRRAEAPAGLGQSSYRYFNEEICGCVVCGLDFCAKMTAKRSIRAAAAMHAEGRNLAATTGYVRKPGGAKARQKSAQLAAKQVRREIPQHVLVVDRAVLRDVRKYFAPDRNALLDDPRAAVRSNRFGDRRIPLAFIRFPSQGHAASSVFVAWF